MRTKTFIIILFTAAFGFLAQVQAQTAKEVRVGISREKAIVRNKLNLRFLNVVEDSRCPKDAQCIWAGNAKVKVQINKPGGTPKIFEINSGIEPQTILIEGYEIRLVALTPEPGSNIRIRKDGYVATFSVTKVVK